MTAPAAATVLTAIAAAYTLSEVTFSRMGFKISE